MEFVIVQALTGLASASSLFLIASGLTLIFGVTRVVNFAHGSLYMLGAYAAYSFTGWAMPVLGGALGFWIGILLAVLAVGLFGALLEILLLRRIYGSPELFQLLATFGVVLVVADATLALWGPEDLLGPRAPGLEGAVRIGPYGLPEWDLALILIGPLVLAGLWLALKRTRWGVLVRAATADREMTAALGVDEAWLFTGVFCIGTMLAALGGALQMPREPANLGMDLGVIAEVFVVTVVGGMGNVLGAFLAAVLIGQLHAFGIIAFPNITIVLIFLFMAAVLIVRPWGLLGRPERLAVHPATDLAEPIRPLGMGARLGVAAVVLALAAAPALLDAYSLGVLTEVLIFALFASSLHLLTGVAGMISFGHAAYFGLGAYGAALAVKTFDAPMLTALPAGTALALAGAALFGLFCVRLAGVYLAMLTLAFAQICFAIAFQWYDVTGGDNGLLGIWPPAWASGPASYYWLVLGLTAAAVAGLRHTVHAPFGFGLRAARDSELRAEASGIDARFHRWMAFAIAGAAAGLAGSLHAFFKGSVFPETLGISVSVDGLVMMLLGGVESLTGPLVGAALYKTLQIYATAWTDYWRAILGLIIIALVVLFPRGIVGGLRRLPRFARRAA